MINTKDVLRLKVPYPSINDELAIQAHMYICVKTNAPNYEFVKCQTLKPKMIMNRNYKHYVDEPADINRNPFLRTTRIDCDKTFTTAAVIYNDMLKTTTRPDICQELFNKAVSELTMDGYGSRIIE